ncbi:MAG: hypothetical protein ABI686_10550, partial [Acidobacteriota bacterium]
EETAFFAVFLSNDMFGRETMPRAKDGDVNSENCVKLVRFPSPTPVERKRTSLTHYVKCWRAVVAQVASAV